MAQRQTLDLQSVKTRQIVYQNPDGTFPSTGGVLTMGDARGHAAWTRDPSVDTITLATGGTLAYDGTDLLLNGVSVQGVTSVTGGTNITVTDNSANPIVNLDIKENLDMNNFSITSAQNVSVSNNLYVGSSTYSYSPFTNTAIVNSPYNIAISAGSTPISTGSISMITESDGIINSRVSDTGGVSHGYTHINKFGIFQVGSTNTTTEPRVQLQGMSAGSVASIKMYNATSTLTVESTSASATMKIAMPLRDVSSGTAGVAGQVLTSAGAGAPPYWGNGGILGRYWTKSPNETITIDSTLFPGLPLSGNVKIRIELIGGGGGGSGGNPAPLNIPVGSGGGGGQGYVQSAVIIYPIGAGLIIQSGVGGLGGAAGVLFSSPATPGTNGSPTLLRHPITNKILATALGGNGGQLITGGAGFSNGTDGVFIENGGPGGSGGGYYGGSSNSNGGIGGITSSGTGCGGGGGSGGAVAGNGGDGDCGSCLIEIIDIL